MGDPAGVGPEIIVKACRRLMPRIEGGGLRLSVIGHRSQLDAARALLVTTLAFADNGPLSFLAAGEEAGADPLRPNSPGSRPLRLSRDRTRGATRTSGRDRRHRHRAAEQGGAEPRRLPLRRPHRHAGGADQHAQFGHAAGPWRHARRPCHHARRAGRCAEAADAGAAAADDRPHACSGARSRHREAPRRGGGAEPACRRRRPVRPPGHRDHHPGGRAMPRRRA